MNVLVAGIGNIFLSDDGFGVEVVQHIDLSSLPNEVREGVTVRDFGIRGVHLSYQLLDGYDALVLIDAMPLGEAPGTVVTFEPDVESEIVRRAQIFQRRRVLSRERFAKWLERFQRHHPR